MNGRGHQGGFRMGNGLFLDQDGGYLYLLCKKKKKKKKKTAAHLDLFTFSECMLYKKFFLKVMTIFIYQKYYSGGNVENELEGVRLFVVKRQM